MTLYLHEQEIMRKSKAEGKAEERELAVRNMLKKLSPSEIIDLGYEEDLVRKIAEVNKWLEDDITFSDISEIYYDEMEQ